MLVKLDKVLLCLDTRIPLTDIDMWGPDAVERNMKRCGCIETNISSDLDNIKDNAKFHLVISCHHDISAQDIGGELYLLGYPGKEYILMTNEGRRKFLTNQNKSVTKQLLFSSFRYDK